MGSTPDATSRGAGRGAPRLHRAGAERARFVVSEGVALVHGGASKCTTNRSLRSACGRLGSSRRSLPLRFRGPSDLTEDDFTPAGHDA